MPQSRGGGEAAPLTVMSVGGEGGGGAATSGPVPPLKKAGGAGVGGAGSGGAVATGASGDSRSHQPPEPYYVPLPPSEALTVYKFKLSCDEYREIWNYSKIYFYNLSKEVRPIVDGTPKYDDADGAYLHSLNEHIAFR